MKLKNIVKAVETGAYVQFVNKEISDIKVVYALSKQKKQIDSELQHYAKHRDAVMQEFGDEKPDEKGTYIIAKENADAYLKKLDELQDVEVDNINIVKIDISLVDKISAIQLENLEGIIEFVGLEG